MKRRTALTKPWPAANAAFLLPDFQSRQPASYPENRSRVLFFPTQFAKRTYNHSIYLNHFEARATNTNRWLQESLQIYCRRLTCNSPVEPPPSISPMFFPHKNKNYLPLLQVQKLPYIASTATMASVCQNKNNFC